MAFSLDATIQNINSNQQIFFLLHIKQFSHFLFYKGQFLIQIQNINTVFKRKDQWCDCTTAQ